MALQEEAAGNIDSELAIVLSSVALACKQISSLVARSGISGMTGLAGASNIQVCCCLVPQPSAACSTAHSSQVVSRTSNSCARTSRSPATAAAAQPWL